MGQGNSFERSGDNKESPRALSNSAYSNHIQERLPDPSNGMTPFNIIYIMRIIMLQPC